MSRRSRSMADRMDGMGKADDSSRAPRSRRPAGRGRRSWIRRARGRLLLGGVVALGVLFYLGAIRGYTPADGDTSPASVKVDDPRIKLVAGRVAPDFSLPDISGSTFRLADARAKGNVLLFIQEGVACPACFQQMRDLQRDAAKLTALDTTLITVAPDSLGDLKAASVREKVVGMPLLSDTSLSMSRAYEALYVSMHAGQVPGHTFILLDRSGTILWRQDYQEMYVPVDQVLAAIAKGLGR